MRPNTSDEAGPNGLPPTRGWLERQASKETPLLTIRPLSAADSIDELTALLHEAYASLGAMGLNYTAVDQSPSVTAERIAGCMCLVAERDGRILGTATVRGPYERSDCAHYTEPDVAIVNQVAVHPSLQGQGLGSALLAACGSWARQRGYRKLALDTAIPAAHLVALYKKLGYEEVAQVQWDGKRYRSVVLSRHLRDAQPLGQPDPPRQTW